MKKFLFSFATLAFLLCGCGKSDDTCNANAPATVASATETSYLQNYIAANNITAAGKQGMFYTITNPGSGLSPNLCSEITVTYTGILISGTTDGSQFDASTAPVSFTLNQLIDGWKIILPMVKAGGSVNLYIPPSLGYGAQDRPGLPANSYLKFTVNLISVKS